MARLDWSIRANLKLRHMQLLVALDDMRHVGRAADLLTISQPAVSKSLSEIERGLGLRLFERGARGIVPTEYGECLVGLSRDTLQRLEATGERLRHLQHGAGGRVRVGAERLDHSPPRAGDAQSSAAQHPSHIDLACRRHASIIARLLSNSK